MLIPAVLLGCSKKDPLEDAAPPPSPNAVQEQTHTKKMPGANAPMNPGGGSAPGPGANTGGMQGAAEKPPGM